MDYSQWKKGSVLHINLPSMVRLDYMAVSFYFRNFANGSERKGLSAFTGKFPSSAAGLHLVLKKSCLRKKSHLVRYRMVECFHAITIDAKRLQCRCEQYCIIIRSRNKSFSRNPFEFLHIRESLVSRSSRLERFEHRGSRIESRGSSFECQLTFERYCK